MALEWQLKLKDGMSGPAKQAAGALGGLEKKLGDTAKKTEFFRDKLGKLRHSSGRFATEAEKIAHGMGGIDKALKGPKGGGGRGWFDGLKISGTAAAGALAAAFAAAVAVLKGGVDAVAAVFVEIASFQQGKSKTLFAFDKLLGPGGGAQAWNRIRAAADKTKTTIQETATAFNNLIAAGFSLDQADTLFKQLADLKTLNPQANIDGIVRAIGQIRNIGTLQGDELNQLAEAGVNVGDVYEELGKRLGKTKDEVMKLKEAGKIKAEDAIAAIQTAISKRTGGDPGSVAGQAPKGAAESWERIKQKFFDMVNLDFGPLTRFLDRLEQALDGEGGKELAAAFEDLGKAAGEFFDSFTVEDLIGAAKGFADVVRDIADTVRAVTAASEKLSGVWQSMGGERGGGIRQLIKGSWDASKNTLKGLAEAPVALFTSPIRLAIAALEIGPWLLEKFTEGTALMASQTAEWFSAAWAAGASIVDGIIAGISAKAGELMASMSALGTSAIDSFGASIGFNSPAAKFMPAGMSIPQGVGVGVDRGTPAGTNAVDRMAVAMMGQAGKGLGASIRAGGADRSSRTTNINMQNPDPSQWDQRMRQIVRAEMRSPT